MLAGNDYGMEPFTGRHDAFMGLYLKGNGKGGFNALSMPQSGLYINGDAKGFATIQSAKGNELFIATQNQDSLKVYQKAVNRQSKVIRLKADDFYADITYKNKAKKRVELYYGSTYLSQSSRVLPIDPQVSKIIITNYRGQKRELTN
jgi:hypothetical protein